MWGGEEGTRGQGRGGLSGRKEDWGGIELVRFLSGWRPKAALWSPDRKTFQTSEAVSSRPSPGIIGSPLALGGCLAPGDGSPWQCLPHHPHSWKWLPGSRLAPAVFSTALPLTLPWVVSLAVRENHNKHPPLRDFLLEGSLSVLSQSRMRWPRSSSAFMHLSGSKFQVCHFLAI